MSTVHFVKIDDISERIQILFESEKRKLSKLLPEANIEHVGATSIKEALSKGDLDINVRVELSRLNETIEKLKTLYDINQPENWTSGFASFKDDSRELGVQVTVIDSRDDYFVAQREYLRNNSVVLAEYNSMKKSFDGKEMYEYRRAKEIFFDKINKEL